MRAVPSSLVRSLGQVFKPAPEPWPEWCALDFRLRPDGETIAYAVNFHAPNSAAAKRLCKAREWHLQGKLITRIS